MITIIKPGTKERAKCKTCGCEFVYEKEDKQEACLDGYKCYEEYVICPQCGEKVHLWSTK